MALSSTEAKGTVDTIFLEALPHRVGQLEIASQDLAHELMVVKGMATSTDAKVTAMAELLRNVDAKLDQSRTRRPDYNALASWAGVLVIIMGLVFGGLSWRMALHESSLADIDAASSQWHYERGRNDSTHEYFEKELDRLRAKVEG